MSWVPPIGRFFGRTVGCIAWTTNHQIKDRLSYVDNPPSLGDIWGDLGIRCFEFIDAHRQIDRMCVPPEAVRTFQDAAAEGKGVLVATIHLGHWELMAAKLSQLGHSFRAVATRPKDNVLYKTLLAHRSSLGIQTLAPGAGARRAVQGLVTGETISLFVDQNTGERGSIRPFLGQPAPTPSTFERLMALTDAVPLFLWNVRSENGQYIVHAERPPNEAPMDWLCQRVSDLVSTYPKQWVWMHDRWSLETVSPRNRLSTQEQAR